MRKVLGLGLGLLLLLNCPVLAQTGQQEPIRNKISLCNPNAPTQCAAVDSSGNIPITGGSSGNASIGANSSAIPTSSTQVGGSKSGNLQPVTLDSSNNLNIDCQTGCSGSNASVSVTGAAVPASGTYVCMNVSGNCTGLVGTASGLKVDGSAVTQPVSAASLPLPTGASTSALQTTGNSSLSSIVTNTANAGTPTLQSGSTTAVTQATASNLNAAVVGVGTAGSPSGGVVSVQGVSSGMSLPVTCGATCGVGATGSAVPANANYIGLNNGGNTIGLVGDSSGRGIIVGAGTLGTPAGGVATVQGGAAMTPLLVTPSAPADPCFASAKLTADFEGTASGGSIITAVSAKKSYICSISIMTSTAANVSIIEGTGSSVCTGGTPSGDFLNTGTTAANGAAFAANGGIQSGGGMGTIFQNATANQNTCVAFTTTNSPQVNVHVSYVQQ